jgi:hypothetical protein
LGTAPTPVDTAVISNAYLSCPANPTVPTSVATLFVNAPTASVTVSLPNLTVTGTLYLPYNSMGRLTLNVWLSGSCVVGGAGFDGCLTTFTGTVLAGGVLRNHETDTSGSAGLTWQGTNYGTVDLQGVAAGVGHSTNPTIATCVENSGINYGDNTGLIVGPYVNFTGTVTTTGGQAGQVLADPGSVALVINGLSIYGRIKLSNNISFGTVNSCEPVSGTIIEIHSSGTYFVMFGGRFGGQNLGVAGCILRMFQKAYLQVSDATGSKFTMYGMIKQPMNWNADLIPTGFGGTSGGDIATDMSFLPNRELNVD